MNDIAFNFKQPNNYKVVEKNQSTELIGTIYDYATGNPAVASVKYTSNAVTVTGLSAGEVTIGTGNQRGIMSLTNFQIRDSALISEYVLKQGGILFFSGPGITEPSPVTTVPAQAHSTIKWESFDTSVAAVASNGTITSAGKGAALILGKFTDTWGIERDIPVFACVGLIGGESDIIKGDDSKFYKPVGCPPNVYEKVDKDGNPLTKPPEYIYNPDGKPGNGKDKNAVPDDKGGFWVEENPPGNIWLPVDNAGKLSTAGAVWGGDDGKPGGEDDSPASIFNSEWWVHMGQNVWKKVLSKYQLGQLTGGGPDWNPATNPAINIYDNTEKDGKYYIGPIFDDDGNEYYYGDPPGGNKMLDSTDKGTAGDDVVYYKDKDGNMTIVKQKPDIAGTKVGESIIIDGIEWIKIKGDYDGDSKYSLLMLKNVLEPWWAYGDNIANLQYDRSDIKKHVDGWYENLKSPMLKSIAVQANTGTDGNPSWPLGQTGIYAHLPKWANVKNLDASVLSVGKPYWLATPTQINEGYGWTAQEIITANGSHSARDNVQQEIYARPIIWVTAA